MDNTGKIAPIIAPLLEDMGYDLVRVQLQKTTRPVLQIMIERHDNENITINDCTDASHAISTALDVEDPIKGAWNLELSSAGIDRPLTRPYDFEKWKGFNTKIETNMPINEGRKFFGHLNGMKDNIIYLTLNDTKEEIEIDFQNIIKAKLVLDDTLINFAKNGEVA